MIFDIYKNNIEYHIEVLFIYVIMLLINLYLVLV